ncbi:hypothetical protein T11_13653 [Trichinella zimbabwensis]|uniref:Uncharacterized protein n=1 Tax=Trichinella zimbabwensis TaxID=268475 RepID=A0A0V1HJJ8_9BILA|nr:hypothetical protein T11_13653 [Trichinella zimbabwensis]
MFNMSTCMCLAIREKPFLRVRQHHGLQCLDDVIFAALLAGQTCARPMGNYGVGHLKVLILITMKKLSAVINEIE